MKLLNRISLRMRITLLTGTILLICSVALSIGASYNAQMQFNTITIPENQGQYRLESAIPDGHVTFPTTTAPMLTEARKQFNATNVIILAIVSILGMVMVYFVAGRSLRPIHELGDKISAIGEENLQERIPDTNRNDEVGMLSRSFNTMLDRIEKSFLSQKRFSVNVAHELKTPLATINAGIQVFRLEKNPTVSDYEETLASAERNVNRLIEVVNGLLSLYEQDELHPVTVDLQELFESILRELQPKLHEKRIETALCFGLEIVHGNPVLLYRACFNLVENAVKYNQDGGKISIETRIEDHLGKIIISDTGSGIPSDELQQIFEPFYRVNKSRSRKTGGAGIGLSIVKAIVEKHGWKISADSELGQGSSFIITTNGI
jgi:Signal transduction histidine kinase